MITEREILIAGCGVNSEGSGKSILKIETKFIDIIKGEEIVQREIVMDGPVLNIHRNLKSAIVDVKFPGITDYDLVQTVKMLNEFTIPENSMDSSDDNIPVIQLTFMPKELEGIYFGTGIHASWVLMASDVNKPADTIRFIFDCNEFHTYRISDSAVSEVLMD